MTIYFSDFSLLFVYKNKKSSLFGEMKRKVTSNVPQAASLRHKILSAEYQGRYALSPDFDLFVTFALCG